MKANFAVKMILSTLALTLSLGALAEDKLKWDTYSNLDDFKGTTFLNFMQKEVKPKNDVIARQGYIIKGGESIRNTAKNVYQGNGFTSGVTGKYLHSGVEGAVDDVEQIKGQRFTMYELEDHFGGDFSYPIFIGLASGGGVAVRINDFNWAYNVHYGSGDGNPAGGKNIDKQTGRSFGASPERDANDASDVNYLNDLEKLIKTDGLLSTMRMTTQVLTACDTSGYSNLSSLGQGVATDFVAVYIAEQLRNLMDDFINSHWDAALAEVTWLSTFHAGQSKLMTMTREGVLARKVKKQARAHITNPGFKRAQLNDYWQFGTTIEPNGKGTGRSGINVTRPQFRRLGRWITNYERQNNPALVKAVLSALDMQDWESSGNLYQDMTDYLISEDRPTSLGSKAQQINDAWVAFLAQVQKDANAITQANPHDETEFTGN